MENWSAEGTERPGEFLKKLNMEGCRVADTGGRKKNNFRRNLGKIGGDFGGNGAAEGVANQNGVDNSIFFDKIENKLAIVVKSKHFFFGIGKIRGVDFEIRLEQLN